nr:SpaA isopeptide-forming pilin-related protein [uncultured Schaedlerella sp.]
MGYEAEYPALETVRSELEEDEIVTAGDYEVESGSSFDVEHDFSGMEIPEETVTVKFHEAKNQSGQEFDRNCPDTYRAVYFVEPVSGNPSYHICRNIIVKEDAETSQLKTDPADGEEEHDRTADSFREPSGEDEDSDSGSEADPGTDPEAVPAESMTEAEMEAVLEDMEQAEEAHEDAQQIAEDGGLLLYSMDTRMGARRARASSGTVSLETGQEVFYPTNLGNYSTNIFTVNGRIAYCLESAKGTPATGGYASYILEGNPNLQKALYYGFGGAGDLTNQFMPQFGDELKYVFTHIAASYFYCGIDGFEGCTMEDLQACGVLGWINYLADQPAPPDPYLSLSKTALKATGNGSEQRTESIWLEGDSRNQITLRLPENVTFHNEDTGETQTGGSVRISGGTSFYFTAPMSVSGTWNTGEMRGSLRTIWKALVVTTGDANQDIGSYYEEESGNSVRFSVQWMDLAKVKVVKVDSASNARLSGAVFGIYQDEACRKLIVTMPATNQNGESEVEITKTQDTVYLKEITAPSGYRYNATAYRVALKTNQTVSTTVPDIEQLGNLTIYKEGEALTGAVPHENGLTFQYGNRRQKGAVFNVYAAKDIVTPSGAMVFKSGQLVAENLETGADGSVTVKNLHLGTYRVTEVQAPKGFYNAKESKEVVIAYAGQTAEAAFSTATFQNDRQKAEVSIVKKDQNTMNGLAGGIFGLYAAETIHNADGNPVAEKDALIEKATTGTDGNAVFSADLPIGFGYYVKEVQAPSNYLKNEEDTYAFQFEAANGSEAKVSFAHTFTNERVSASIQLSKVDKETNQSIPQGDATLEHAVYGLYAKNDISHPDGKTGAIYKAGEQVGTLTTDGEGKAEIDGLYLGEYFVKEITPPAGYLADETEYDLVCSYEGELSAVIERSCTSPEQVIKQPFQIVKAANNGESDAGLLAGAGFTAYLTSSLHTKEDGGYDFDSAEPVVLGANGETEIFTDENGYACSIPLPFGTYIVRETTVPQNYKPVKDFLVHITENHPDTPQAWRVLLDEEFEAKLRIVKKDDESKKPVLVKNTEFKIYDLDRQTYVEQVTTYPTVEKHQSFFTDEQGCLVLPQNLKIGHYRIEEVTAPNGYMRNGQTYEISVDSDTLYQMDGVSGDVMIDVVCEDHPVKGKLHIVKKGQVLKGYDQAFLYEAENLAGAEFEVSAAEDIYTPDGQKDGEGNRIREYAAGELVTTLTTDREGKASVSDLPLGTYRIVETKAPEGFALNEMAQTIILAYEDQDTPVVEQTAEFENELQKAEIAVVKKDAANDAVVAGAVFGLYPKTDITVQDETIVKADTLLGEAATGEDGKAVFELGLPFGEYYIREQKAPAGYVLSDKTVDFTVSYQGQDVKTIEISCEFENEPTTVSIKKTDLTTGKELEGATLTVLDSDGNVVDTWTSMKGEEHLVERLAAGETYILREEMAPYGYLRAEEIEFTVEDTAEIQKVEMKDDVPTGMILINKQGELLENVSLLDSIEGWISYLFEYVTGSLKDVTFEVYALENIKAADGVSGDHYKKDELVDTITTDETGIARLENLPLGKYYIREKETAQGYLLDGEIREVDLTYRDQDTPVVTFSTDWQNLRQKVEIQVLKTEKDSDRVVPGTVFSLCTKEDITNAEGKVILEADTVIEEKATDEEGKLTFTADLPVGFSYYVKETAAASGFTTMGEVQEFDFSSGNLGRAAMPSVLCFENETTVVEFSKVSLTDGTEVEGAKLQVTDPDGNVIDAWVSGKEPHIIRELEVGKTYQMTETLPADGYVTASTIEFTVENTNEVQKVEMKDDVTKVEISKTDIAGKELPGAKLTIYDKDGNVVESWVSEDKPHYIEMLSIGEYRLHEEAAPEGYLTAEDIRFEVKDTGEIQKVAMKDEATRVEISKTDIAGKELPGAKLTIYDRDGNVVESWVSEEQPHYIEMLPAGEYRLHEESAPEGYLLAEDIRFEVQNTGETQKVTMKDERKPEIPDTPKTGDRSDFLFWLLVMGLACIGVVAPVVSCFRDLKKNGK